MALGTPSLAGMQSAVGFKSDSKALGSSVRATRDVQKVLKKEVASPLQDMSKFFASIDKNIIEVAKKVGETTGISKLMAKIMGDDLKISKAQAARDKKAKSIGKAKSGKVEAEDTGSFAKDIIDTLKESFKDLVPKESLGDLTKILLLATGAAVLIKFADKFKKVLAPVLEFLFDTLIPGFKELVATINKSPTGFLGIGGVAILATTAVSRYGASVRGFFTGIIKGLGKLRVDMAKEFARVFKAISPKRIQTIVKAVVAPLSKIGAFLGNLGKTIGGGAKAIGKLIPFVSKFASIGKTFLRFLGPVGIVIQAFVGLFSGITRAVKTFKAGGSIFAVIGSFFSGIFDALIGSVVNLLADVLGFIVKKLGFEKLGEMITNIDFTTDGIGRAIVMVVDKIKGAFNAIVDNLKGMANSIIKKLNLIPGVNIALFETTAMKKEKEEGTRGSEGTNMAEDLALNERARLQGNEKRLTQTTGTTVTAIGDTTTEKFNFKQEKAKVLKAEQEKLATQKAQTRALGNINAINNSKGATTVNQTSVHSNGEPASDHNDMTAKHLTAAFAV
jgi:hypothetical protein